MRVSEVGHLVKVSSIPLGQLKPAKLVYSSNFFLISSKEEFVFWTLYRDPVSYSEL